MAGAFTPTCSADHLPGYIKALPELRAKGVDVVAVLAHNDPFVMSGWGKAYGVKNDDIVCPRRAAFSPPSLYPALQPAD